VELDEDDFKEEIRAHLAIAARDKISDGVDPADARQASFNAVGGMNAQRAPCGFDAGQQSNRQHHGRRHHQRAPLEHDTAATKPLPVRTAAN